MWKAVQQLELVLKNSKNADFVVFDSVLREKAIDYFLRLFQGSTIWFDLTNGEVFASHSDDGLSFPSVTAFVQVNFSPLLILGFFLF